MGFKKQQKIHIVCEVFDIHNWNYEELGLDEWLADFPQCKGVQQSPINIVTSNAVYNASLKPFEFIFYDMNLKLNFSNNGHTSIILNKSYLWKKPTKTFIRFLVISNELNSTPTNTPQLRGSDFGDDEVFFLNQFHFHWGFNNFQGNKSLLILVLSWLDKKCVNLPFKQGSEHHIDNEKFPLEVKLIILG